MDCIICNQHTNYFFTKNFNESSDFDKSFYLGSVDYWKCTNCGFVYSKTHKEMSKEKWIELNDQFHHHIENEKYVDSNQPPYLQMAVFINLLYKHNIIEGNILDFGAGYGTLNQILTKYFNIQIDLFDEFIVNKNANYINLNSDTLYSNILTSAVFEHITERKHIDRINDIVKEGGAMFIHTLICENVPMNPNWFYLLPVHTAFFTNKSMSILMKQWGYKSSLYCPEAKTWLLLKKEISNSIEKINEELQHNYMIHKMDFVDYWKTF
jgi:2-polyprenyl-3-methyl-5-hydroxy-6-metoxy-1,4-benzoquinol methylase